MRTSLTELEGVRSRREIIDRVRSEVRREYECVGAGAAGEDVGWSANQGRGAAGSIKRLTTGASIQHQTNIPIVIEILLEAALQRFHRRAGARHPAHIANSGNVVAVVVGIPGGVVTARVLPGDLIAARRLLRTDRRPGAKITGRKIRAAKLQRGPDPRLS